MAKKVKSEARLRREQRQEMKGFFNAAFRDTTMSADDWRLIEKGIKSFQNLSKQREQDDLINLMNTIKIRFNDIKYNVNRVPVRLVYACILALIIIPKGAGGDKTQKDNIDEIVLSVVRENKIHHYDATAIEKAAEEYNSLKLLNHNNSPKNIDLLTVMRQFRA